MKLQRSDKKHKLERENRISEYGSPGSFILPCSSGVGCLSDCNKLPLTHDISNANVLNE